MPPIVLGSSIDIPAPPLFVVWSISQRYAIFDHRNAPSGQFVQNVNLETFATRAIKVSGSVDLLIRDGVAPEIEKRFAMHLQNIVSLIAAMLTHTLPIGWLLNRPSVPMILLCRSRSQSASLMTKWWIRPHLIE